MPSICSTRYHRNTLLDRGGYWALHTTAQTFTRFLWSRFSQQQQQQLLGDAPCTAQLLSCSVGPQTRRFPQKHPVSTNSQRCLELSCRHKLPFSLVKKPEIQFRWENGRPLSSPRCFPVSLSSQPASAQPPLNSNQQLGVLRKHPPGSLHGYPRVGALPAGPRAPLPSPPQG